MTSVLVTGGAGFIGAHLIEQLLTRTDYSVVSLDRLDEAANLNRLSHCAQAYRERLQFVWHDLRAAINPAIVPGGFRYIVHMAAASHVDRSVKDPVGFLFDNVIGTAHVFEYARTHAEPEKVLYFSTDEVFGPAADGVAFDEHDPHTPNNPYAAAKAAAEALVPAYANTYGLPLVVSHCTNVYGPGQYREKFIPLVTAKIRRGETVQIHSRSGVPSSRYYVHVEDVCAAVLTILARGGVVAGPMTGKYNISGEEELSNLEVARRIAEFLGKPLRYELVEFVPNRPRHDMRYAVKCERLQALGWTPRVSFTQGLADLLANDDGSEAAAYELDRPGSSNRRRPGAHGLVENR